MAGLVLIVFRITASPEPISWANCNEIAVEFALISIGANGAIFLNPNLIERWGVSTPIYGILAVLVNLLIAGTLMYRDRRRTPPVSRKQGIVDLFLGVISISITSGILAAGYKASEVTK